MTRGNSRLARPLVIALLAIGLVGVMPAAASGAMAAPQQRSVWQHICERAAGGILSDQPALVCDHFGEPQWSPQRIELLTHFCRRALGGQPVYRSQYPQELVACQLG